MAEVTSGTDLTVLVLNRNETQALTRVLNWHAGSTGEHLDPNLFELYDALNYEEGK